MLHSDRFVVLESGMRALRKMLFAMAPVLCVSFANAGELGVTAKSLDAGVKKYLSTDPDCKKIKWPVPTVGNNGNTRLYRVDGYSAFEVVANVSKSGKLSTITMNTAKPDTASATDALCISYAVMRTLQPEYETKDAALSNAIHLWKEASSRKFFRKAFYFDVIEAKRSSSGFEMLVKSGS